MSCFVVSAEHINALAHAACTLEAYQGQREMLHYTYRGRVRVLHASDLERVTLLLLQANWKSYIECYKHRADITRKVPRECVVAQPRHKYSALELLKAVQCYEYQSCEVKNWHRTEAFAICQALMHKLVPMLPHYDQVAGWSLDGEDPAKKRPLETIQIKQVVAPAMLPTASSL